MQKIDYRLYAVSDRSWLGTRTLAEVVEDVLRGGATVFQLREKHLDDEQFYAEGLELKSLCERYGVPLIINDNVDVARRLGVGVHIGQGDMSLQQARELLGKDVVIGVSCQTVAQAVQAEKDGADYLGVGAVFSTSTKLDADYVDASELYAICSAVSIPVVAIGGISRKNLMQLGGSGIDGIAVVSALFAAEHPEEATRDMLSATDEMLEIPVPEKHGAIIDMDGTILDSMKYWETLTSDYLRSKGAVPEPGLEEKLRSMEMSAGLPYIKQKYNLSEDVDTICKELIATVYDIYAEKAELFPGAREMLEKLHNDGVKMALFTSNERKAVMASLRKNNIEQFFDCIITTLEHKLDKATPNAYYYVLGRLGTDFAHTTIYEDAPYAIAGAKATGMHTVEVKH